MKNQKGFIPVVIILVILIGFVGIYYLGTLKSGKIITSPTPIESSIASAKPSPVSINKSTLDPTTNWKVYTNNQYKFSFNYPDKLSYLYDQLDGGNLLLQNFDGTKPRKELNSDFQIVIFISKDDSTTLEQLAKNAQSKNTAGFELDGAVAIKGTSVQKDLDIPTVWVKNKGNIFTIQMSNVNSTNKAWFDLILSTFKFI